jgi:ABC-type lipoprotein export system ATPase subunit
VRRGLEGGSNHSARELTRDETVAETALVSLRGIARALANHPRIIMADEPTAALDSKRPQIVMGLLRKLAVDQKAAVIVVTHDEKVFDRFDRMFMLRDGRLDDIVATPKAA